MDLFAHTLPQLGITTRFADHRNPSSFEPLIDANTKAIFVESLGNPQGNVTDIAAVADVAHRHGIPLIVDNTVATIMASAAMTTARFGYFTFPPGLGGKYYKYIHVCLTK
mgnify:FL=1